jgi:hypothetical protein
MPVDVNEPRAGNGQPVGVPEPETAPEPTATPEAAAAPAPEQVKVAATVQTAPGPVLPDEFASAILELQNQLKRDVLMIVQGPGGKFEQLDDSLVEAILRTCHTKPKKNVAVLLHSTGGSAQSAYRVAKTLETHCNGFVAVVPRYAKSAATLLSLGAIDIIMSEHAELGPLDAQFFETEREGIVSALDEVQSLERLHAFSLEAIDRTMMLLLGRTGKKIDTLLPPILRYVAEMTRPLFEKIDTVHYTQMSRALKVAEEYAIRLLGNRYPADKAGEIARQLVHGYPEHGFIIDIGEAKAIGLDVQAAAPELEAIMDRMRPYLGKISAIGYLKEVVCA